MPYLRRSRTPLFFGCLLFLGALQAQAQILHGPFINQPNGSSIQGPVITTPPAFQAQAKALADALTRLGVQEISVSVNPEQRGTIVFKQDPTIPVAAYFIMPRFDSEQDRSPQPPPYIEVSAASGQGAAHAASTLLQLAEVEKGQARWNPISMSDEAAMPYRSFMVDMGRNPHSPETLRAVVTMMWLCGANYLHLHLTDDQLFSWPSKAYPKLYSQNAGWTWEDFEQLEAYSQARGVTIIPEIDVPGHSTILRREYPEVFGKTPTELATLPQAQKGVETLIGEFCSVFRATPYIHIGGDEAYGVPHEAQRDFINRLNAFVKAQGKRTVVWEGPPLGQGDNKVDTDVLHINWRTIDFPAQAMLDAGYEVINASWDPMYIVDHYPRTMFTAVDVERCYQWNPLRFAHINHELATFAEPHFAKSGIATPVFRDLENGILGFCMPYWEGREENLFALCLPRLSAVTARAWFPGSPQTFGDFQMRQAHMIELWEKLTGLQLPSTPIAQAESQVDNHAFMGHVHASSGNVQPPFGPERLTNGLTDRFDHFLGFPTQPEPLQIDVCLIVPANVARIRVYETAVGASQELYELQISPNGEDFQTVGTTELGSRGENPYVDHRFDPQTVHTIRILTQGCHNLTFPSFSRLCEVMAFAE